jgi:hypothetical protein
MFDIGHHVQYEVRSIMRADSYERLSLIGLSATIATTGIHHVFRLGPQLIVPFFVVLALAVVLMWLHWQTGRRGFFAGYSVIAGLVVLWFGVLDGLFDHVLKGLGLENITFLPGSDADVIATAFQLWSQEATTMFYESTGVLTAVLCLPTIVFTSLALAKLYAREPSGQAALK